MDKCYMCEAEAVTREHAPPYAFFPKGHRRDLITVPSCDAHNHKNSNDVEYVRNVIVSQLGTKQIARKLFRDKVMRSYHTSPKLAARTFSHLTPILVDGMESRIVEIEIDRFQLILKAIAYALHRRDFKTNYAGSWEIFSPQLLVTQKFVRGLPDGYEELRSALSALPFAAKTTANPEVFRYGFCRHDESGIYLYRFEFYEGFIVYAIGMSKTP